MAVVGKVRGAFALERLRRGLAGHYVEGGRSLRQRENQALRE